MPPTPTVEDFLPLASSLARHHAWLPSEEKDLAQEGLISLYLALQKTPAVRDPRGFAITVMSRAMREATDGLGRRALHQKGMLPIIEECLTTSPDPDDELFLSEYFARVEDCCGSEGRRLAENLVSPTEDFGDYIITEVEEKQKLLEVDPSLGLRGTVKVRVSHRQLREALGLSSSRWHELLGAVREVTLSFLQENCPEVPLPEMS